MSQYLYILKVGALEMYRYLYFLKGRSLRNVLVFILSEG